jgi:hypothetical protein
VHTAGVFVALVVTGGMGSGVEGQIAAHTAHVTETAELNDTVSCTQQVG